MNEARRAFSGDFSPRGLRRYLRVQALVFWGFIFLAWLTYPAEHHFSILTHTFSFLGSYNPEHHPRLWWIFSIAMLFWGVTGVPIVLHLRQRFARFSRWGASIGAAGMLLGCAGLVLVGLFPDVRTEWRAGLRYTQVHTQAALLIAVGYGFGLLLYALVLLKALVGRRGFGTAHDFPLTRAMWPFAFWLLVSGTSVFMVLRWERIYLARKAAAMAAGQPIGTAWAEGLKTWYAFPLWENLAIYALYITLVWLSLTVLPDAAQPASQSAAPR